MNPKWIVQVVDHGRPAFLCEQGGELYLTRQRSEAAIYPTELDARCAKVYVGDRYRPTLVLVHSPAPAARPIKQWPVVSGQWPVQSQKSDATV